MKKLNKVFLEFEGGEKIELECAGEYAEIKIQNGIFYDYTNSRSGEVKPNGRRKVEILIESNPGMPLNEERTIFGTRLFD